MLKIKRSLRHLITSFWRLKYESERYKPPYEKADVPDGAYVDGAIANKAVEVLENIDTSQPFFLAVGFKRPHLPFNAPTKYWDLYDRDKISISEFQKRAENSPDIAYKGYNLGEISSYSDIPDQGPLTVQKQKELIHGYMAAISYVDAQIGLILDKLETLGLRNKTVIVLWGDHGFHLGDHGLWTKHTNFEQAVRSPLIISAPKGYEANKNNVPSEFVDIFPTLCELSNIETPAHLPGKSLVPIMKKSIIFWFN